MVFIFRHSSEESEYQIVARDSAGLERLVDSISTRDVERAQSPHECLVEFVNRSLCNELAHHLLQARKMPVRTIPVRHGKMNRNTDTRPRKKVCPRALFPGLRKLAMVLRFHIS